MTGYPISLHLQGKKCVVFGAGKTAQRRVQGLLQAGAAVTVIAPEPKPDCWNKADLTYVQAHYQQAFLEESLLVFAATNDAACNAQIVQDAQALGKLVSTVTADAANLSDFSVPATRCSGAVTLSVTTDGKAPALSAAICDALVPALADCEMLCTCICTLRNTWKKTIPEQRRRAQLLRQITASDALALFREQGQTAYLQYAAKLSGIVPQEKTAILTVSFGTAYAETREQTIGAVERAIGKAFPEADVYRAFTSSRIVCRMRQNGTQVDTVNEALERLKQLGYTQIFCQPTYVAAGKEYEQLCTDAAKWKRSFLHLSVGVPLLMHTADYPHLIQTMAESGIIAHEAHRAYLLMGHGTAHAGTLAYPVFEDWLRHCGYDNVFVGTLGGVPTLEMALAQLKKHAYTEVVLSPMLLAAGKHVQRDMAGEHPSSWKSILEQNGYSVTVQTQGLGAYPAIQERYVAHLRELMASQNFPETK